MSQSQEELVLEISLSAIDHWVKSGKKPSKLLLTENNTLHILMAVKNEVQQTGRKPEVDRVGALVKNLGDMDFGGKLQYHKAAGDTQEANTLPHDDIEALKNIRNLADVSRVINLPKEKLKQFANLKPGSPSFKEFNERIQHIKHFQVGKGEPETLAPEKVVEKKQPIFSAPPEVTQAHELVDAMTLADIATVTSSTGRRTALANKKESLHQAITQMRANGESAASVLQKTKDAIKKSGAGGIQ
jgi:hypothetical protein